MQHVRALNRQFMKRLLESLLENVNRYREEESWVEAWAGKTAWEFPTPCELAAPLSLLLPDEGNLFDLENAIRMHKALPNLTPVQAQDPRLWTRLTHVELWEYMRARWPVERYLEPQPNLSPIRDRYFVVQRQSRVLVRNGASRLWWAAKMTCDPDRDNPYELTHVLLSSLDIYKNLLERNFGRSLNVTRTFLEFLLLNKEDCLSSGEKPRQLVRDLSKAVNLHGGVCLLDCKTQTSLMDFLNREKDRLVAKNGTADKLVEDEDEDE
jgi:Family of unknown function (DUF6339)